MSNFASRPSREMLAGTRESHYEATSRNPVVNAANADDFNPEAGWNVYSDFNNTGPRYSDMKTTNDGYQAIPSPSIKQAAPSIAGMGMESHNPVELVTVPALGAEWKAEELRAMTKKGKREDRSYSRGEKWKAWTRDQRGLCGEWGTRKSIVWGLFIMCCITGVLLAFMLPRVPGIYVDKDTPLTATTFTDSPDPKFGRFPATFAFNASLSMKVDTGGNFLPLKFNNMHAEVSDLATNMLIATGDLGPYSLPAKAYTQVYLPLLFNYTAANTSDATWANMYNACNNKNQHEGGIRPGINLSIQLFMDIAGLVTRSSTGATMPAAPCPFELPGTA